MYLNKHLSTYTLNDISYRIKYLTYTISKKDTYCNYKFIKT
jgi:hypothetical protein